MNNNQQQPTIDIDEDTQATVRFRDLEVIVKGSQVFDIMRTVEAAIDRFAKILREERDEVRQAVAAARVSIPRSVTSIPLSGLSSSRRSPSKRKKRTTAKRAKPATERSWLPPASTRSSTSSSKGSSRGGKRNASSSSSADRTTDSSTDSVDKSPSL